MKKERFTAFFDAVMAIIMTIDVLEFVIPSGAAWSDLDVFWFQLLAYAVSFFWLATLWINVHSIWNYVEVISRPILFVNMIILFFSSLIPFLTVYLGRNVSEAVPQILFGIDVILIILWHYLSIEMLCRKNEKLRTRVNMFRTGILTDAAIKIVGVIIGVTVFPQAVMIAILATTVYTAVFFSIRKKKYKRAEKADTDAQKTDEQNAE